MKKQRYFDPAKLVLLVTGVGILLIVIRSIRKNKKSIYDENLPVKLTLDSSIPVVVKAIISIAKSQNEVYTFLRKFENHPLIFRHLTKVVQLSDKVCHWEAADAFGRQKHSWKTELTPDPDHRNLRWRSVEGDLLVEANIETFHETATDSTVSFQLSYCASQGTDSTVSKWLNPMFYQLLKEDLQHVKRIIESF